MTLNHNYGCFSGVGFGIAANSKPADLPRLAVIFGRRQLDAFLFLFDIARFQHTGGGLFYLAAFPHHKQR